MPFSKLGLLEPIRCVVDVVHYKTPTPGQLLELVRSEKIFFEAHRYFVIAKVDRLLPHRSPANKIALTFVSSFIALFIISALVRGLSLEKRFPNIGKICAHSFRWIPMGGKI